MPALVAMRFLMPTCPALALPRLRETEPAPRDRNRRFDLYDQLEPSPDTGDLLRDRPRPGSPLGRSRPRHSHSQIPDCALTSQGLPGALLPRS
jgi:hypothetical protein